MPNNNVDIISVENEYFVEDEKLMMIKTCHCRALTSEHESQDNLIAWYPDEDINVTALIDGQRAIENIERSSHDTNFHYDIYFGRKLKAGEEFDFKVEAELTNRHHHFKSFFSVLITNPLRDLTIIVHLDRCSNKPKKIMTQMIYQSAANYRTEQAAEHSYSDPFIWKVEPQVGFECKVWW